MSAPPSTPCNSPHTLKIITTFLDPVSTSQFSHNSSRRRARLCSLLISLAIVAYFCAAFCVTGLLLPTSLLHSRRKGSYPRPRPIRTPQLQRTYEVPARFLTPAQELAAVTSLLTSSASNILPNIVDPATSIDPHLVLEFDIGREHATEELNAMQKEVWSRNPVVFYAKSQSAVSTKMKYTLLSLDLYPPPTFIDVDSRDDVSILRPLLMRLTHATQLPILIIGGEATESGSADALLDDYEALGDSGRLVNLLKGAGAVLRRAEPDRGQKNVEKGKLHRAQGFPVHNRFQGPIRA